MSEEKEFPQEVLERIEEVRRIRKEIAEEYMQTGNLSNTKFARIHVLLQQASEYLFERFPVVFLRRQAYIMPAPSSVSGIKLFLNEGYELVLPSSLEGKSLEEIAQIQKENLPRLIPVGQLLTTDAEYMFYLEAYFRAQEGSYIKENALVGVSMDVEKHEFVQQEESEEFVSANASTRKRRKVKGEGL